MAGRSTLDTALRRCPDLVYRRIMGWRASTFEMCSISAAGTSYHLERANASFPRLAAGPIRWWVAGARSLLSRFRVDNRLSLPVHPQLPTEMATASAAALFLR